MRFYLLTKFYHNTKIANDQTWLCELFIMVESKRKKIFTFFGFLNEN